MNIILRPANKCDCIDLYKWRNHVFAREMSRNNKEINYEEHVNWFKDSLKNLNRKFYIAVDNNGDKIGHVRFDKEDGSAEISVTIDPNKWGKGYGTLLVRIGTKKYMKENMVRKVRAEIKKGNIASEKIFEKAGYKKVKDNGDWSEYWFEDE